MGIYVLWCGFIGGFVGLGFGVVEVVIEYVVGGDVD